MKSNTTIGILRVLTTEDSKVLMAHQKILEKHFPEFTYVTKCISNQFKGIHNEKTYEQAYPKIVELAKEWEMEIDGLIISCAGDPAVKHLQKELTIPVVGAGIATASLSLNFGERVGIIGIEKSPPSVYEEVLGDRIVGYELPKNIVSSNDLRTEKGKAAVLKSAKMLLNKKCDVLAFACTGLSTVNTLSMLKDIDIPVIDAVIAEGLMMKYKIMEKNSKEKFDVQD